MPPPELLTLPPCGAVDLVVPFLAGAMSTAFLILMLFLVAVWGFGYKVTASSSVDDLTRPEKWGP